jgi:hypothetical protein
LRPVSDSELGEGCDPEKDALMLRELERLKASDSYAPPLWVVEPELMGMSNAI